MYKDDLIRKLESMPGNPKVMITGATSSDWDIEDVFESDLDDEVTIMLYVDFE